MAAGRGFELFSRDSPTERERERLETISAGAIGRESSGTVVASPSAAYGIAHDTEAAGSLALEANLSRGFAGSRVKFLRMHRRLPSLPIPPRFAPVVGVSLRLALSLGDPLCRALSLSVCLSSSSPPSVCLPSLVLSPRVSLPTPFQLSLFPLRLQSSS